MSKLVHRSLGVPLSDSDETFNISSPKRGKEDQVIYLPEDSSPTLRPRDGLFVRGENQLVLQETPNTFGGLVVRLPSSS